MCLFAKIDGNAEPFLFHQQISFALSASRREE